MRRKKHKQTRRAVNYFKVNYGFHEPYKVLLDGNFIHATLAIQMGNLDSHLPKLLGGNCKLYTTRCISKELRSMGDEFKATAQTARGFMLHKCEHDTPVAAAECIKQQIGTRNGSHWFVATQDQALRQALGKVPGCPIVFATVNGVHLETPSALTKQLINQAEEQSRRVQRHERAAEALRDLEELTRQRQVHTSVRFRRNKAKGPNPLAIKRKATKGPALQPRGRNAEDKRHAQDIHAQQGGDSGVDDDAAKKRRKRSKAAQASSGGTEAE